jgi:hypothetical protein
MNMFALRRYLEFVPELVESATLTGAVTILFAGNSLRLVV